MKLCGSGSYLNTPPPVPKMPPELMELMEGLTKEVLKNNPNNVHEFCAEHMWKLLELRDNHPQKKKLTLEQKIVRANNIIKQRAEKRCQKYDKDMKILSNQTGEIINSLTVKTDIKAESFNIKKIDIEEKTLLAIPTNILNNDEKLEEACISSNIFIKSKDGEGKETTEKINVDSDVSLVSSDCDKQQIDSDSKTNIEFVTDSYKLQCMLNTNNGEETNAATFATAIEGENINAKEKLKKDDCEIANLEICSNDGYELKKMKDQSIYNGENDLKELTDESDNNDDNNYQKGMEDHSAYIDENDQKEMKDETHNDQSGNNDQKEIKVEIDNNYENDQKQMKDETHNDQSGNNDQKEMKVKSDNNYENDQRVIKGQSADNDITASKDIKDESVNNDQNEIKDQRRINDKNDQKEIKDQIGTNNENDQNEMKDASDYNEDNYKKGMKDQRGNNGGNDQNEMQERIDLGKECDENYTADALIVEINTQKEVKGQGVADKNLNTEVFAITENEVSGDNLEPIKENQYINNSTVGFEAKNKLSEIDQDQRILERTSNIEVTKDLNFFDTGKDRNDVAQYRVIKDKEPELKSVYIEHGMDSISNSERVQIKTEPQHHDKHEILTPEINSSNFSVQLRKDNFEDENIIKPLIINIEYGQNDKDNTSGINNQSSSQNIDNDPDNSQEIETVESISSKIMDLETAAVTIQKVFRNFLFRSKTSSLEDSTKIEFNIFDHENGLKDENGYSNQNQILNKDKRAHGISRMDTVLQTVNEEKSLSLSTDDSSTLSSAATVIQAHIRGFLVRTRLNRNKTVSSTSLADSDVPSAPSFEADPDPARNKTILNIHIVPEGHFLSRDESMLTSVELSLDGSPPASINLHPLGYDKSERRKQLKREDAIQSISPPSNNSTRLSEEHDSVKEVYLNDGKNETRGTAGDELPLPSKICQDHESDDIVSRVTVEGNQTEDRDPTSSDKKLSAEISSDESDVITPYVNVEEKNSSDSDSKKLLHSGEFHDVVLPTKVSRTDTSVVRDFQHVLVYFLVWNNS